MTATSATGVGHGSSNGGKGPKNGRSVFVPLTSPHVVWAGSGTTASNVVTITFPAALTGDKSLYSVHAMATASSTTVPYVVKHNDSNGNFDSFVLHGAGAVAYDIVVTLNGTPFVG